MTTTRHVPAPRTSPTSTPVSAASDPAGPATPGTLDRPQRRDAQRNRELLIGAARRVFARRGLEASLDDVAREAGLGVGTAYRHFANKHELAKALITQAVDTIVLHAQQAVSLPDPWEGLVTFLEGALMVQAEDRGLREVFLGIYDPEQFDAIHDQLTGLTTDLLHRCQEQGLVRADAEISDIGFVMTMVLGAMEATGDLAPDLWRRYLALCLQGLRPGGPPLPGPALPEREYRTAMLSNRHPQGSPAR